jgi:hypothetical protein
MTNEFFTIFLCTVLITRIFLYFNPKPAFTIKNFRTHHWMYGLIGIIIAVIFHSVVLYAIGLGLFVDELTYLIIGGKNHTDNYSVTSLFGTVVFIILIFFLRNYFITFVQL